MKIYHYVFEMESNRWARWYTIINGEFYYWSAIQKAWTQSGDQDDAIKEYFKAQEERRVHRVQLKGRVA